MDQTFEKREAMAAAQKTIALIQTERARRIAEYDAKSVVVRFFIAFSHDGRWSAERYGVQQEQIAKRIWFKTQCTEDSTIYMTDEECDAIMDQWGAS